MPGMKARCEAFAVSGHCGSHRLHSVDLAGADNAKGINVRELVATRLPESRQIAGRKGLDNFI